MINPPHLACFVVILFDRHRKKRGLASGVCDFLGKTSKSSREVNFRPQDAPAKDSSSCAQHQLQKKDDIAAMKGATEPGHDADEKRDQPDR
jgi:hypothetical protein